jgi:chorismate--pyruvate lyase
MQRNKINWQSTLDSKTPGVLRPWLDHAGSFTQRLVQHGVEQPKIDILREGWVKPEAWEADLLCLNSEELAWIREVRIFNDNYTWMYARTVVTNDMLKEKPELSTLENRSLGSILFNDPTIKRDAFEFIFIEPAMLWQNSPIQVQLDASWVRRSVFTLRDRSLLLTEILMPDLTTLCLKN